AGNRRLPGPAERASGPAGLPRGAPSGGEAAGRPVSEDEISKRLAAAGQTGEEQNSDSYAHDSIEAQLLYERIYRKLTRRVQAKTPEELSAKRNQVMAAFVAKLQRETRVRYEPGFAPSS